MTWYDILLDSTISTTKYLKDNYQNVDFKVISQEENGNKIIRVSEFINDNKVIVHSSVEIDVEDNPETFIDLIREKVIPIGDILRYYEYKVERKIIRHDNVSKEYVMTGDVELKITEKYYEM
jgi:hypothetical protein